MPVKFGPLSDTVHICVDMQRMFVEPSPWHAPWAERIMPKVTLLCRRHPERTAFTRFVPAKSAESAPGAWRRYYERWPQMTLERLPEDQLQLAPALQHFVPQAMLFDKWTTSPWYDGSLAPQLIGRGVTTLIVSGLETEICVLATVMGAIDHGFRVVIASDAVCSSADETHDAMRRIYDSRFGMQIEVAPTDEILQSWIDD